MNRAVVLLSAGLDSSYNLFRAKRELDVVLALTFNYGQKAARQEIAHARALCARTQTIHQVVELPWFREFTKTSLVAEENVPVGDQIQIDDLKTSLQTMQKVWVPNRNGIFLNIAAGFAEGRGASLIIPGFNLEEASTFPDNSRAYMDAADKAFSFSTQNHVKTFCYSTAMTKTEIVKEMLKLEVPLDLLWPCYHAYKKWCGECESCQRFKRAVNEASL